MAPARPARPCSATASRSAGRAGAKPSLRPNNPLLRSKARTPTDRGRDYRSIPRRAAPPLFSCDCTKARRRQNPNRSRHLQGDRQIPEPSHQPEPRPSENPFQYQILAREALRALSTRTRVPIGDALGRGRRPRIAAARHTTVLHSIREVKKRSAHDLELRAYMTALSLPQITAAPTPSTSSHFLFSPPPPNLRLMTEGDGDGYR